MKGKQEQERVVATWLWKVILNKNWKENKYNDHAECRLLRETLGCCMKSVCFNTAGLLIKMQEFLDPELPIFLLGRLDYDLTFFTQFHHVSFDLPTHQQDVSEFKLLGRWSWPWKKIRFTFAPSAPTFWHYSCPRVHSACTKQTGSSQEFQCVCKLGTHSLDWAPPYWLSHIGENSYILFFATWNGKQLGSSTSIL